MDDMFDDDGVPGAGKYIDFDFDFEAYFDNRNKTEEELEELQARIMGAYVRDVFAQKVPPRWVLGYIATALYRVLKGWDWNDAMPLPWHPATPLMTRSEERTVHIYVDVSNALKADPDAKVTQLLQDAAFTYDVSYETARAAYYSMKKKAEDKPEDKH